MLKPTEKIWHNGRLIPWDEAKIHVLSHVVNYGSSVFEGIRCYDTASHGPAIFRLKEHMRRLVDSAKIYRMDVPFGADELAAAHCEVAAVNGLNSCYLRPIVFRGYGDVGVLPFNNPVEVYIACWQWGKYLGEAALAQGVDVCVSSWTRIAPNTLPALAKAGAKCCTSPTRYSSRARRPKSRRSVRWIASRWAMAHADRSPRGSSARSST